MENNTAISIKGVKKKYRLGQIGGGTLQGDLQSWWARKRGKEDPNSKIGTDQRLIGQTFMALNGIDLEIKQGEAVGIIGKNGAGKSTLLKLLSRVTAPSEGTIDIYGRITSMLEVGTGFHPEMTGRENVYMNGAILGMTRAEIDSKMDQIIEFSEVGDFIDTPVKRYSSGMYVKLAFSVAAHLDSEIMIMDEVLAVGDMKFQQKCLNKMRDAATVQGKTVLYVSHNMNTIRQLCDRCIVLSEGKVIFDGDVEAAIDVYLGKGTSITQKYVFEKEDHESWCNQKLFIDSLHLYNDPMTIFCGDDIKLDLNYHAVKSGDNLRTRLVLLDDNDVIIGMSLSDIHFSIKENTAGLLKLSFSTLHLGSGKYHLRFSCFDINEFGSHEYVCVINDFFFFELNDRPEKHGNMNWSKKSWGSVAFDDFSLEVV